MPCEVVRGLPNRFRFFGLSRSTRCGCCSYQVSSISDWRVTCYDHFCVFQFFSHSGRFHGNGSHFEKINPLTHNFTWHMIFLPEIDET
jgi:hypothetical protein